MNVFAIVILAALVLDYSLGLVSKLCNLKSSGKDAPPALQGIYKPEEYRKSQEYLRATTRFGLVGDSVDLVLVLVFWFAGGFNRLDQLVRGWEFSPLATGLLYVGILFAARYLLALPFTIYGTFVIEERFGFNRTTLRTFVADNAKGLALSLLLGGPLLAGALTLFQSAGSLAWLYVWGGVTIFSLVAQYVAPIWIMPLFNKFTPMGPGEMKDAILNYAASVNFPVKNVTVMDASRRSSKGNAFFTGFGRNRRIALFDTLLAKHTVGEMVAILAHEIGHYKKKHIVQRTVISLLHTGVVFFLVSLFLTTRDLFNAFQMEQPSVYAGLIFFGLLYTPVELALGIAMRMLYRKQEREADRFAAETISKPAEMAEALKKLASANLSNLTPHPLYVFLNYSHPPLAERVEAIQKVKS